MYPDALNNPPPGSVLSNNYFNPDYLFDKLSDLLRLIFQRDTGELLSTLFVFLSLFFICIMLYCVVRLFEIRKKEHHHLEHEIAEYAHKQGERERKETQAKNVTTNPAWVQILEHMLGGTPAEWKLAIIEADTLLDRLLTHLGFKGESLGDKLKAANQDNFRNLSTAWEVHTIRNRIAHDSTYQVSLHETKRVIALYEQIFRAYGFI